MSLNHKAHHPIQTLHAFSYDFSHRIKDGFGLINIRYKDRTSYLDALKTFNDSGSIEPLAMLIAERALETVNYAIHIAKQKEAMRKGTILN